LSSGELLALVKASIEDYADNELTGFNATLRKSTLQNYIENCEKSITGSDIDIVVQKQVKLDITRTRNYAIGFNMPLKKAIDTNRLSSFPQIQVYDSGGVLREALFEEVPETKTGILSIELIDSGTGYTSVPTVTIIGDGSGAIATAEILSGRVSKINIINPGTNYSSAVVTITGGDGSGATAVPKFEARIGTLRTIYYKSNREKVIINGNAGSIDYDSGIISLSSLRTYGVNENSYYDDNVLAIDILPENEIVAPLRNRILDIDVNNPKTFQINMIVD
jgi:hypothetical protein